MIGDSACEGEGRQGAYTESNVGLNGNGDFVITARPGCLGRCTLNVAPYSIIRVQLRFPRVLGKNFGWGVRAKVP
jgi:hypothetical protein